MHILYLLCITGAFLVLVDAAFRNHIEELAALKSILKEALQKMVDDPKLVRYDIYNTISMDMALRLIDHIDSVIAVEKDNPGHIAALMTEGYNCSKDELLSGSSIHAFGDICSEVEWFRLAQLILPDASSFVDVGANKGYVSALFVSFWGYSNPNFTKDVHAPMSPLSLARSKIWSNSSNSDGFCKTGANYGISYTVHAPQNALMRTVPMEKPIVVHSFDGSQYIADKMNDFISSSIDKQMADCQDGCLFRQYRWKYHGVAVSNKRGFAMFTTQNDSSRPGFEGGHIASAAQMLTRDSKFVKVPVVTLDEFAAESGDEALQCVHVLKIDAEGSDRNVINGAKAMIDKCVQLLTFEADRSVFTEELSVELDMRGFSCYSSSRIGLLKWSAGCLDADVPKRDHYGNIFCASRSRAPLLAFAFDALSLPVLRRAYYDKHGIVPKAVKDFAIRTKPFCSPWPRCISKRI